MKLSEYIEMAKVILEVKGDIEVVRWCEEHEHYWETDEGPTLLENVKFVP